MGGVGGGSGQVARASGGGQGGGPDLVRVIRRRIEEAKIYPDSARRAGLQGTAEVAFRIGPDGSPVGIEIVRSSGSPELDDVARDTIRRAAPYPLLPGRLRIPLAYRLDR
jgi:protein TonB